MIEYTYRMNARAGIPARQPDRTWPTELQAEMAGFDACPPGGGFEVLHRYGPNGEWRLAGTAPPPEFAPGVSRLTIEVEQQHRLWHLVAYGFLLLGVAVLCGWVSYVAAAAPLHPTDGYCTPEELTDRFPDCGTWVGTEWHVHPWVIPGMGGASPK